MPNATTNGLASHSYPCSCLFCQTTYYVLSKKCHVTDGWLNSILYLHQNFAARATTLSLWDILCSMKWFLDHHKSPLWPDSWTSHSFETQDAQFFVSLCQWPHSWLFYVPCFLWRHNSKFCTLRPLCPRQVNVISVFCCAQLTIVGCSWNYSDEPLGYDLIFE